MRASLLMMVWGAAGGAACTRPWARGPRVTPLASGLVGEWVATPTSGSPDTTLLRFSPDGTVERVRMRSSGGEQTTAWGPFRVVADTGRRQLLCFSFRRGRALPACRYFEVDPPRNATQWARRALHLLNWVGEKGREPEIWTERIP